MKSTHSRACGLTLIELIVTLAVAVALALIAAPMYNTITTNNVLSSATNLLQTHMHMARSEAIKRGAVVTICSSGDGATCADSKQWGVGWIVFEDAGTPGDVDGTDTILAISPTLEGDVTIGSSDTYIRYLPDGTIQLPP